MAAGIEPRSADRLSPSPAETARPRTAPARNRIPPARHAMAIFVILKLLPDWDPPMLLDQILVSPAALSIGIIIFAACSIYLAASLTLSSVHSSLYLRRSLSNSFSSTPCACSGVPAPASPLISCSLSASRNCIISISDPPASVCYITHLLLIIMIMMANRNPQMSKQRRPSLSQTRPQRSPDRKTPRRPLRSARRFKHLRFSIFRLLFCSPPRQSRLEYLVTICLYRVRTAGAISCGLIAARPMILAASGSILYCLTS